MPKPITSTNALTPGRTILVRPAAGSLLTHVLFIGCQTATKEFVALCPNGDIESLGSFASWLELEDGAEAEWLRAQSNWNDAIIQRAIRRLGESDGRSARTSDAVVYQSASKRRSGG